MLVVYVRAVLCARVVRSKWDVSSALLCARAVLCVRDVRVLGACFETNIGY